MESRKLISDGVPEITFRLSRRRRFIPVAFDVDGDAAATLFVRRGVSGNPWLDAWALQRREGEWVLLGGGSGDGYYELFDPREAIDGLAVELGSGWSGGYTNQLLPWPRPVGVSYAEMRMASRVASLRVNDRHIAVPAHGLAVVVWGSRRPPTVAAMADGGEPLGAVPLGDPRARRRWR